MTRSSTSSSEAWRRAFAPGVVALVLLVAFDAVLPGSDVWQGLEARVERGRRAGFVVRLESRLARLGLAEEERPRVVVLGNSRALAAIDPEGLRGAHVTVIARPGMEAFQQRSLAERVARGRPDAVIVAWSEFDTHRPVRLEPVVGRAVASAPALLDLLRETDASFVWRNRDTLLRASLASLSNGYRFREVLGEAFGFAWRRFPTSSLLRAPAPPPLAGRARIAFWDAEPPSIPESVRREARDLYYPPAATLTALRQIDMVAEIRRGRHVDVQTALLRRTVETLHDAGAVVIVVEAPLAPVSRKLYDTALGGDFSRFVQGLVDDFGVRFVPLSSMPRFRDGDFLDLMHVNERGRKKLTRAAAAALQDVAGFVGR